MAERLTVKGIAARVRFPPSALQVKLQRLGQFRQAFCFIELRAVVLADRQPLAREFDKNLSSETALQPARSGVYSRSHHRHHQPRRCLSTTKRRQQIEAVAFTLKGKARALHSQILITKFTRCLRRVAISTASRTTPAI